jgi:D-glycero-alpha-D-manno-heptose-7-phosphate kinase
LEDIDRSSPHIIHCHAPIRICDLGGWTDTWFAQHGQVLNITVQPGVDVQLTVTPNAQEPDIIIQADNYGDRYTYHRGNGWQKHPLLEAAIESMDIPLSISLEVRIRSTIPAGAATGTSAAVVVALLGALNQIVPHYRSPNELAYAAWRIETEWLGLQSGIQDQLAAAHGGINLIEMHAYPNADVTSIQLPPQMLDELERRLVLVYLGQAHQSSDVHQLVIQTLEAAGSEAKALQTLRATAIVGRDALLSGDLDAFGKIMIANHNAQGALHPDLISPEAHLIAEIAARHGASGWKVNGAGGSGGSLTILSSTDQTQYQAILHAIRSANPAFQIIPVTLAPAGARAWTGNR